MSQGVGSAVRRDTEGMKEAAGDMAGNVQEGTKGAVSGGTDTVKGGVGALGDGAKSAGGALGGVTGLGGK